MEFCISSFSLPSSIPRQVISFHGHVQICVPSSDSVPGTISKGLWSLPAGVPPNAPVLLCLPCSLIGGSGHEPRLWTMGHE